MRFALSIMHYALSVMRLAFSVMPYALCIQPSAFSLYHSAKERRGGGGSSLCLYQGLKRLFTRPGATRSTQRPALPASLYKPGLDNTAVISFIPAALAAGACPSCVMTCRHLYSCWCMSIFTG